MNNLVFSMTDDLESITVRVNAPDGVYQFKTIETSWTNIKDIPKQKNVINTVEEQYPDFTKQIVEGEITVKDGLVDMKQVDDLFPDNWSEYNTHIFLEELQFNEDNTVSCFLGS